MATLYFVKIMDLYIYMKNLSFNGYLLNFWSILCQKNRILSFLVCQSSLQGSKCLLHAIDNLLLNVGYPNAWVVSSLYLIKAKGANKFKWTNIDVKMSTFLQFLLHLSMWCHFNGMGIIKSRAYWVIWILKI
jgi:hypothetical protein